tara:strand:+ start:323 stop:469 length:147 start_codon:yes stop_codon:yes gene_type:complete
MMFTLIVVLAEQNCSALKLNVLGENLSSNIGWEGAKLPFAVFGFVFYV